MGRLLVIALPAFLTDLMIAPYLRTADLSASLSRALRFAFETLLPIFTEAVLRGKMRLHSMPIRQAPRPSLFALAMSVAKLSANPPGPFSGRSPLTVPAAMFWRS